MKNRSWECTEISTGPGRKGRGPAQREEEKETHSVGLAALCDYSPGIYKEKQSKWLFHIPEDPTKKTN